MQAYLVFWVHHYVILRILWCKTIFLVFDCKPLLFISVYECYTRAYLEFLVHHFVFMINKVLFKCCITLVNLHGCYTSLSCIWFMPLRNILRIVVVYKFFQQSILYILARYLWEFYKLVWYFVYTILRYLRIYRCGVVVFFCIVVQNIGLRSFNGYQVYIAFLALLRIYNILEKYSVYI